MHSLGENNRSSTYHLLKHRRRRESLNLYQPDRHHHEYKDIIHSALFSSGGALAQDPRPPNCTKCKKIGCETNASKANCKTNKSSFVKLTLKEESGWLSTYIVGIICSPTC